ncbi:MAG: hypothetical protein HY674_11105 [Chloroflexi bacterium]|nr:hypothetical protein [Chloroflexota bacterium]
MMDGPTSGFAWLADESAALRTFSDAERAQMDEAERRNFPEPEPGSTIWRYLETYKFEDLLKTETLYLRQVSKLAEDEPNEGIMNQFQRDAMRKHFANDPKQFAECLHLYDHLRQRAWVTCFSLGDFDESHMWKKFCKKPENEGVVVKTTYRRLKGGVGEVVSLARRYPYMAKVRYEESDYLAWKLGYLLYQKLPQFSDECEVRICAFSPEEQFAQPTCVIDHARLRVQLMLLVQQVYVHPKATDAYFKKIRDLTAKHLPERQGRVRWSVLRR